MKKTIFLTLFIAVLFSGCFCLKCIGNGSCAGTGKCIGHGICKNGYGKCIRPKTTVTDVDKEIEKVAYTCEGFGSCDGKIKCNGEITEDKNGISYCNGYMECTEGSGTCQGDGECTAGIGVCENSDYSNCVGNGSCEGVGLCLGLPGISYDGDINLEKELFLHKRKEMTQEE